jgi:nucleoside 2-deoxyribosyltransferase
MAKFYLAAKYDKRRLLLTIATMLMLQGHSLTCQWLTGCHDGDADESKLKFATLDFQHIDECDTFVMFNLPIGFPEESSGRHAELGYALAKGKRVLIVGEGNCIFTSLAEYTYPTVELFLRDFAPDARL